MMSEFANTDWDLEAVIRGWSSASAATTSSSDMNPISDFAPGFDERDQDLFFGTFPDVFVSEATADFFDELEGLYKPFYPQTQPQTTASALVMVKQEDPQPPNNNGSSPIISAIASTSTAAQIAKYKRSRKNQQKRVVQQAKAEGLSSSDKWAWRKYGQKPIKGSPYPRSYYRCSSSKGCPARKQVEQSCADPGMYVITYTADHNHSHPTRRNSLSGVARTKFKLSPAATDNLEDTHSCSAPTLVSEDGNVKAEDEEILQAQSMEIFMPDIVFSDDLFPNLEDLHGCIMD